MDPWQEKILRGLQDTMTVMEGLQRRQGDRLQDHQEWLESMNAAWARHEENWAHHEEWLVAHDRAMAAHDRAMAEIDRKSEEDWARHQEWLVAHDRAMAEIDRKLDSLIEAVNR